MPNQQCFYTLIYTVCVVAIVWPLYIYLLPQWYFHRNHFVIRNRWPAISLIIIVGAVIIQVLTIIEAMFCIDSISHLSIGIINTLTGLVYYRCFLLYAQTMKTRQYLTAMESTKAVPMIIQNENKRYHIWSKIILCTVLTLSIVVTTCRYLYIDRMVYVAFSITTLIGIICLCTIVRQKVSDSIGITRECIIQISQNFVMLVIGGFTKSIIPSVININLWLGFMVTTLYGFFSLIIAYNLIQNQPTPDCNESRDRARSESTSEHQSTGLNVPKNTECASPSVEPLSRNSFSQCLHESLLVFLNENVKHLLFFAEYLSECFALENILFLERAIILHHVIKTYQSKDTTDGVSDGVNDNNLFSDPCYRLKFNCLIQIYEDIETMIENGSKRNKKCDDMICKRGIVDAMKCIYKQFCCRDSDTEINVQYDVKNKLDCLFDAKNDDEILKQFKNYDDLLIVFHFAIVECWAMCESVYGFQFKRYLQRNVSVFKDVLTVNIHNDDQQIMKTIVEE